MEHNLERANQSLGLSQKVVELAKVVFHVNQLLPYPLTDLQIVDWSKSIAELKPDIVPEQLKKIIDKMKLGIIDWNSKSGIQNIFKALEAEDKQRDFLSRL